MSSPGAGARYVMGHNDQERRRLALQAAILNPLTEQLFVRAGIASGMHVVDFGCGIGDVSLIAARLVGRHGRVTAVDIDEAALAQLEVRARERGLTNLTLARAEIDDYSPERAVDAVLGRLILIHSADPLRVLRNARRMLRSGGAAVFQEYDFSLFSRPYPPFPMWERACACFTEFFGRATHGDIGARLFHLFLKAGFEAPDCRGEFLIDGGPESPFYEWIAESLRSILPKATALGIGSDFAADIDTLADRLRGDAVEQGSSCVGPMLVGGFARKR